METLVLALGLGMEWPTVDHPHAQAQKPHAEHAVPESAAGPRRAVVAEDGSGQTMHGKQLGEMSLHSEGLLIAARTQADRDNASDRPIRSADGSGRSALQSGP